MSKVTLINADVLAGLAPFSYNYFVSCVCDPPYELKLLGLKVEEQKPLPLVYKEITIDQGYRIDLLVEDQVVVELKTVEQLTDVHEAQILTYLKLSGRKVGLLINFNVPLIKNGIKRLVI